MKKNEALFLDIMLNDRFVCTLKYMYCPLFAIKYEELIKPVRSHPSSPRWSQDPNKKNRIPRAFQVLLQLRFLHGRKRQGQAHHQRWK